MRRLAILSKHARTIPVWKYASQATFGCAGCEPRAYATMTTASRGQHVELDNDERRYPLRQPPNYKAPVTRWNLKLPDHVSHIYTLYVGVQTHGGECRDTVAAEKTIQGWLDETHGRPAAVDVMRVTEGFDVPRTKVWAAYWTDGDAFTTKLQSRNLVALWRGLGDARNSIGLWTEHFVTPVERLETNYARLDHKPGVAQIPGSAQPAHNLSAYWGAARDRIPDSASDLFHPPTDTSVASASSSPPKGVGEHIHGANYDNMCHIRSGQWWERCPDDERDAYEHDLQVALMGGMRYLWAHPTETGTLGLRFLFNVDANDVMRKESCGAGFFRNLADLEKWSSTHSSHLQIFMGAIHHAQQFGEQRKFMTWHEVSILKEGEAKFAYVNCDPRTGVIQHVALRRDAL